MTLLDLKTIKLSIKASGRSLQEGRMTIIKTRFSSHNPLILVPAIETHQQVFSIEWTVG